MSFTVVPFSVILSDGSRKWDFSASAFVSEGVEGPVDQLLRFLFRELSESREVDSLPFVLIQFLLLVALVSLLVLPEDLDEVFPFPAVDFAGAERQAFASFQKI